MTDQRPFDIKADWLSFTLRRPIGGGEGVALESARNIIQYRYPELQLTAEPARGRSPYEQALRLGVGGLLFFGATVPHCLNEISGKGCRALEDSGDFYALATRALSNALNITRFDLAVDFETRLDPEEFIAYRSARFKTQSVIQSETGKTCYVGSAAARQRVRVYRYYPPHDRSHLMRVEFVAKKGQAEQALRQYLDTGPEALAAAWGNTFGFDHPLWEFTSRDKVQGWRPETGDANTLRWVRQAVIPALRKLYEEGDITENHTLWDEIAEDLPLEVIREKIGA
jgi:hypothetical protein